MPQSRRLAAIMFTDVVGYTAMMQRNEKEGLEKVHRFSEVMEAQAAANNGEILEFRGDGCLVVFNSAVEAMHAAKSIQESLQKEPQVPLRIGIHIGDIVFTDGNIYGDGVNLASRVESMGVPGSILVTERVIHDVKSHPEFEMTSLGKFHFKNVEKPMELYALANEGFVVPKKQEMQGKLAKGKTSKIDKRFPVISIISLLLLLGLVGYFYWPTNQSLTSTSQIASEKPVIAVLPFRDLSPDKDQEYFCDGTAEEILNALASLKGATVRGRSSSFSFKNKQLSLKEIGEALAASILLEGSIRKSKDKIRINVQLVQAEDESTLWSHQYDQAPGDIFDIQEDIARKVLDQLKITLLPEESKTLLAAQTSNPEAHEWYLKGLEAFNASARNPDGPIEYFQKAIDLDSTYYAAYANLGRAYEHKGIYGGGVEFYQLASQYFEKAIELNPDLPLAYMEYARYHLLLSLDLAKTHSTYQLAVEKGAREPNHVQANLSIFNGNFELAIQQSEEVALNDPLSILTQTDHSRICLESMAYEEVLTVTDDLLRKFPGQSSAMRHRGEALLMLDRNEEALDIFENLVTIGRSKGYGSYGLVIAKAKLGRKEEALKDLEKYKRETTMGSINTAYGYFGLGELDSAFHYLDLAIEQKDVGVIFLRTNGFIQPYNKDPRFKAILERLNIPPL